MKDFTKRRRAAADASFADHYLDWEVEEVHHWHAAGSPDAYSRTVLFCGEAPGSPCLRGHFYVRFEPGGAKVEECYAMIDGCLIGRGAVRAKGKSRAK
jgi:hypothetical protein